MRRIGLFCCLMLFVACTVMAADRSKEKVKKASKQDVEYSTEPIKLDTLVLPKNYKGHNLSVLYTALLENGYGIKSKDEFPNIELYKEYSKFDIPIKIRKKDEFETTDEYEKRIGANENKLFFGKKLGINDVYAFSVVPECTYNADKKLFTVAINRIKQLVALDYKPSINAPINSITENMSGIWGPTKTEDGGTYVGNNSYGAKATIRRSRTDIPVLAFENKILFKAISKRQEPMYNLPNGKTIDYAYRAVVDSFYKMKIRLMKEKAVTKQMLLDINHREANISEIGYIDQKYAIKTEILNAEKSALSAYYYDLIITLPNIGSPVAKQIKDNLAVLILFKLKEPYRNYWWMQFEPTIKIPEDAQYTFHNVYADLKEIWIYDKASGEILSKSR